MISNIYNDQIFFNKANLIKNNINAIDLENFIASTIIDYKHIDKVFTRKALVSGVMQDGTGKLIQNGFHQKRSGDVIYVLEPAVISYSKTGSTHGSSQSYDTHVPLLFYGNGIKQGSSSMLKYLRVKEIKKYKLELTFRVWLMEFKELTILE